MKNCRDVCNTSIGLSQSTSVTDYTKKLLESIHGYYHIIDYVRQMFPRMK